MKDNFSNQSSGYAKYRPTYPDALIEKLVLLSPRRDQALDVATGNGQLAVKLAPYFHRVQAIDISQKQLDHAERALNVFYRELPAEHTDFENQSFDLITVAQAVHWFDFDLFYAEVNRILKPDGIIAVIGYGLFRSNPETEAVINDFYHNITGPFWDPERRWLDEGYKTLPFPFDDIQMGTFENTANWTFDQLIGYLETWSAVEHYKAHHNSNPLDLIREPLKAAWEKADGEVRFPMLLRVGRKG